MRPRAVPIPPGFPGGGARLAWRPRGARRPRPAWPGRASSRRRGWFPAWNPRLAVYEFLNADVEISDPLAREHRLALLKLNRVRWLVLGPPGLASFPFGFPAD